MTLLNDTVSYVARLIENGRVRQTIEFEARDDADAWATANEGVDPLRGLWVEVTRKANPQQPLELSVEP